MVLNQVLIVISQTDALTRYASPSLPAGFLVQTIDNSCSLTGTDGMLTLNLQLLSQRNMLLHHCTMFQMSLAVKPFARAPTHTSSSQPALRAGRVASWHAPFCALTSLG